MFFKGDIIITDPMYIIKSDEDWERCEYGQNLESIGISTYITSINGDEIGSDVVSLDEYKKIGKFCSDSCVVTVMLLNELRTYNSNFDKKLEKHCYAIVKNFEGEIELLEMIEDDGTDQRLYFLGKGNMNFRTDFFNK
ncbi:MAG: hypothetical protein IKY78_05160 [Clostridia bacterium]|nr:hypothetical protein [Clostridia bacterium]